MFVFVNRMLDILPPPKNKRPKPCLLMLYVLYINLHVQIYRWWGSYRADAGGGGDDVWGCVYIICKMAHIAAAAATY